MILTLLMGVTVYWIGQNFIKYIFSDGKDIEQKPSKRISKKKEETLLEKEIAELERERLEVQMDIMEAKTDLIELRTKR